MAEEKATEPTQPTEERVGTATAADMDVAAEESAADMDVSVEDSAVNGSKREREENKEENEDLSKKQKVDKSVEEERLETLEGEENEQEKESGPVSLGPKTFGSAVEMFDYFFSLIHTWPANLNLNKYEHLVLLDLLKKGHSDPEKKIGLGIQAFQVRFHPTWKSRCFFLVRNDDTTDDFSFRKCVDQILPLPEDMKIKYDGNGKGHHGGQGGGGGGRGGRGGRGRGRGRGYGRGGKPRN
ncbi:protein EMBRYO DEFECTIVE 514 [Mercurialis annua]|uniref:protein EMBRYO DEFECTIVE 514 n=1 Tax=Mercurialis annua TaxID=3986 RepID=UPI00215DF390|nr:protein EMBRYO DEFECTIVE 514 [Mercurialis annua]